MPWMPTQIARADIDDKEADAHMASLEEIEVAMVSADTRAHSTFDVYSTCTAHSAWKRNESANNKNYSA